MTLFNNNVPVIKESKTKQAIKKMDKDFTIENKPIDEKIDKEIREGKEKRLGNN